VNSGGGSADVSRETFRDVFADSGDGISVTAPQRATASFEPGSSPSPHSVPRRERFFVPDRAESAPRPEPRVVTVANQKGGVGKTTTTVNLSTALAMAGQRVLAIDLDPQGNASTGFGIPHGSGTPSIYEVLVGGLPLGDVLVVSPESPNLRVAPATQHLAGAEVELVPMVARESRLRKALRTFLAQDSEGFDVVLIDCPPSLGLLTVNALVAAREVLIPIQCEYYALEGLGQLTENVELVRAHLNPALTVSTILLTMYDGRTRLAEQVAEEVRGYFGPRVLDSVVPRSVRLSEAPSYGQSVLTYDPSSKGAEAYRKAAVEMIERGAPATSVDPDLVGP
jgi:chromosome partitioning protein